MKLNTGKEEFKLEFDNGNVESIFFNPNDPNLALRMANLIDNVENRIKNLDVELSVDGKPLDTDLIEQFEVLQNAFFDEFDNAFGGEVSAKVFKYCSPFAIVGGEYFVIQFLNAISPEIQKRIEKASRETKKKMEKHIGKYKK